MGWESKVGEVRRAGPSCHRQPSRASTCPRRPQPAPSPSLSPSLSPSPSSSPNPKAGPPTTMSVSCVTRETAQDDCSYARFVAWAAVKRNTYRFISSSEKLQCPLIRCMKEFPDHERMLQHLASCEHLVSREYWCYDHMRTERFDDMKCRRCISHPSRRRRMVSMAKSFFSTLGHKSKRGTRFVPDLDDMMPAPPSYHESQRGCPPLGLDPPEKPELASTTEILEIDSTEVASAAPVPVVNPQDLLLSELESVPMQSSMQWQPTPFISPLGYDFSMAAPAYESLSAARPTSPGLLPAPQQNQPTSRSSAPAPSRSKNLSPSSSVRSTTSTTSNVSSMSTSSSLWSAPSSAWSGMETNFTSLSVDLVSPMDQDDVFASLMDGCSRDPLATISELPADTELHELSSGDFALQDPLFPFDANIAPVDISYPTDFSLEEKPSRPPAEQTPNSPVLFQSETKALVAAAWDALQEHILSSQAKIKHIPNPLAGQLGMLSPQTIAHKGLKSLRSVLEGRPLTSPLDTLSLIHVIYSFSLVVYGDDATRRSSQLFAQSLLYSAWFTDENQAQFREVATAIWRPSNLTDEQLSQLMTQQSPSLRQSVGDKGKGLATTGRGRADPLVAAGQSFLDELEATAVFSSTFEFHASELRAKSSQSQIPGSNPDDFVATNVGGLMNVLNILVNRFHDADGLIAQLNEVNQSVSKGVIRSTRRFELEALQAGQNCIVPSKYFDSYAPLVRSLCDPIYELDGNSGASQRQDHYVLSISLSEALITEMEAEPLDFDAVSTHEPDRDAFLASLTPPLTDDLMDLDIDVETRRFLCLDLANLDVPPASTGDATSNPTPTTIDVAVTASTELGRSPSSRPSNNATQLQTPPSPSCSPASAPSPQHQPQQQQQQQQQQQKAAEADACCKICGYRPKGDPRWFHGSMAKHKKLQHSTAPPVVYRCSFPGCKSAYKNRPDNLRQHQLEKDHFVDGDEGASRRPSKRKKMAS